MMKQIKIKNLLGLGILGGVLAIISDFLIIYTDLTTAIKLPFVYLGRDIANWRATLSLILALLSYIAYISAYQGISRQLQRTNQQVGIWFYRIMLANALGWLFIHSTHCSTIYFYNTLNQFGSSQTVEIITAIMGNYAMLVLVLFATNTLPLLFLLYHIIRGHTIFPKRFILINPLIISGIAAIPYLLFKESGLCYSIYLAGGNIGVFCFFGAALLLEKKQQRLNHSE